MSDQIPAHSNTESRPFLGSILRRIGTFLGFRVQPPKSMDELEKESPELAKYISELENKVV